MCPANERWRYSIRPSLISWTHTQNDLCIVAWWIYFKIPISMWQHTPIAHLRGKHMWCVCERVQNHKTQVRILEKVNMLSKDWTGLCICDSQAKNASLLFIRSKEWISQKLYHYLISFFSLNWAYFYMSQVAILGWPWPTFTMIKSVCPCPYQSKTKCPHVEYELPNLFYEIYSRHLDKRFLRGWAWYIDL